MMFFGLVVGFELALVMSFSSLSAYKWDLHVFDLPPFVGGLNVSSIALSWTLLPIFESFNAQI